MLLLDPFVTFLALRSCLLVSRWKLSEACFHFCSAFSLAFLAILVLEKMRKFLRKKSETTLPHGEGRWKEGSTHAFQTDGKKGAIGGRNGPPFPWQNQWQVFSLSPVLGIPWSTSQRGHNQMETTRRSHSMDL